MVNADLFTALNTLEAIAEVNDCIFATREEDMEVISEIDDIVADLQELVGEGPPDDDPDTGPDGIMTIDALVQDTLERLRRCCENDSKFVPIISRLEELKIPASLEVMFFEAHYN